MRKIGIHQVLPRIFSPSKRKSVTQSHFISQSKKRNTFPAGRIKEQKGTKKKAVSLCVCVCGNEKSGIV